MTEHDKYMWYLVSGMVSATDWLAAIAVFVYVRPLWIGYALLALAVISDFGRGIRLARIIK